MSLGGGVTTNGPTISLAFNASLAYMGSNGVDVGAIISAVKTAVAETISGTATDAEIEPSSIATLVAAIPGVSSVGNVQINGSTDAFIGSGGSAYVLVPNDVLVEVGVSYE